MKYALVALVIISTAAYGLFAAEEERRGSHEAEHRWIYGFHIDAHERAFGQYLESVTAEGLREIRWDRQPRQTGVTAVISSTTSAVFTLASATGAWTTCSMSPTSISYAKY